MKNKNREQDLMNDYNNFVQGELCPPKELDHRIMGMIHSLMNPNGWLVFSKLSLLHLVSGVLTLSLCPQFGVNILGFEYGLTRFLFKLGPYGCTFLCGGIFVGITLLFASVFLTREEVLKIKVNWILQISSISLLSLGAFIMLDAEILLSFGLAWIIGALIGGIFMLETGFFLRKQIKAI